MHKKFKVMLKMIICLVLIGLVSLAGAVFAQTSDEKETPDTPTQVRVFLPIVAQAGANVVSGNTLSLPAAQADQIKATGTQVKDVYQNITGASVDQQAAGVTCSLPESNAKSLAILNNIFPGSDNHSWDHTHLTASVQSQPNVDAKQLEAIHGAIATWGAILNDCFDGLITLTDVTEMNQNEQKPTDIVVHYVPHAGGVNFAGQAPCGDHNCLNIMVRSDFPTSQDRDPYDPELVGNIALHELGHALGLGHATDLSSTDLMGYGWPSRGDPVLSDCDIDAIAFVFAWALEGSEPHKPAAGPYDCSLD